MGEQKRNDLGAARAAATTALVLDAKRAAPDPCGACGGIGQVTVIEDGEERYPGCDHCNGSRYEPTAEPDVGALADHVEDLADEVERLRAQLTRVQDAARALVEAPLDQRELFLPTLLAAAGVAPGAAHGRDRRGPGAWAIFVQREGGQLDSHSAIYEDESNARDHFDRLSAQWSDAFLCRVVRGPRGGSIFPAPAGEPWERIVALELENDTIAGAAKELLYSVGEYIRQTMTLNPEWRSGIIATEEALLEREQRLYNAARTEKPLDVDLERIYGARPPKLPVLTRWVSQIVSAEALALFVEACMSPEEWGSEEGGEAHEFVASLLAQTDTCHARVLTALVAAEMLRRGLSLELPESKS